MNEGGGTHRSGSDVSRPMLVTLRFGGVTLLINISVFDTLALLYSSCAFSSLRHSLLPEIARISVFVDAKVNGQIYIIIIQREIK